ncbi:LuxR family transcriptional regulator [Trinickia terrae]|uniref:LuxR family transcriptional regulator n=1 Tax=Trinickia terrae TaxID=2571161 RepID=A0A4U1IGM3_9BURK|nr:LuxR family transcriptional regulator [Trinickia terrae]TKC92735.1 LuxR family transcriptional regulator [Trinickia terrae]
MSPLWQAKDEKSWFQALSALGEQYGFDRTLFAVLPRPGMRHVEAYLRFNYPAEWWQTYVAEEFVRVDPTVLHSWTHTRPLVWSSSLFVEERQQRLYEEARYHGLRTGVTLPIHGPKQESGMLCFVSSDAPSSDISTRIEHDLPMLALLRDVAFDISQRFLSNHTESLIPKLTPRECECLKWTAQGKSTWEIAKIFNCSEATVNFHMTNIRTKFGVSSRCAAAVKATRMGLIDPD